MVRKKMKTKGAGIIKLSVLIIGICPHCGRRLSKSSLLRRKLKKICRCEHCGKVIDERFVIY